MKFFLAIVVIAGTYLIVCDAACMHQLPEAEFKKPPQGCHHEGKLHPLGESWRTKSCWDCSCDMRGQLDCCQAFGTPVTKDKNCKFRFDQKACEYVLIENEDPEKKCKEYVMVG
ncbi:beta-microseminoprotein-like [Pyxicephalus adspersus]|uniref:Beta-microseminoprotein n=1 Tax=Pyxicephalus adspersus TaxID=30357 RepID=A0AAV2ZUC1_PYXAD|nr:TPA: hypothetical protein GDO54_004518 [Pyxicephalus adspersus]